MSTFRTKPMHVEAVQLTRPVLEAALFDGTALPMGVEFHGEIRVSSRTFMGNLICNSRQGKVSAEIDDWIIVEPGAPGLCYPCKPDVFAAKYEPAPVD